MAVTVLRILKEIAPLIVQAGGVAAGLRPSGKADERLERVEWQTARAGELLRSLADQLQATALELRRQAEIVERQQRRAWAVLGVALVALAVGAGGLVVALAH